MFINDENLECVSSNNPTAPIAPGQQAGVVTDLGKSQPSDFLLVMPFGDRMSVAVCVDETYIEIANLPYAVGEYVITANRRSYLVRVTQNEDGQLTYGVSNVPIISVDTNWVVAPSAGRTDPR